MTVGWPVGGFLLLLAALTLAGCGYRFSGNSPLPTGVTRVYVADFNNTTSQPGLETVVSNAVMRQFTTLNPVALARDRQAADAVVNGDVTAIRITTISRRGETVAAERRVTLVAKATMTTVEGRVISQTGAVRANETFRVVPNDFQATQDRQSRAIASAAEKLAETLYNQLAIQF